MKLRSYQNDAVDAALEAWQEHTSTLLVLPTGCGKTIVFAHIIDRLPAGERALVLAHRDKLIWQAAEKIERVTGVKPDVEMADYRAHEHGLVAHKAPVIVSTIQTQISGRNGSRRMHRFDPSEFGLVVIDEAHHAVSRSYREVLEYYRQNPDLKVLGVTATPDRKDEAALGHVFDACAFDYEILDAIQDGWLVPVRQRAVVIEGLDYSGVHTKAGDFNEAELEELLETEGPLHGMIAATVEIANGLAKGTCERLLAAERDGGDPAPVALAEMFDGEGGTLFGGSHRPRRTLVFCVTVAHAELFTEILNRWTPESARIVHGKTPKDERRTLYRDYTRGRFQYLCNVGVATEGFDEPGVELVVMARPTKSRALYAQMAGRGTRPLDDLAMRLNDLPEADRRRALIASSTKPHVEILDFVGNAGRHHLITGADILGGKHPDAVIKRAREEAEKAGGKPVDVAEALDAAEAAMKREAEEEAQRKRRRHVRLSATYKTKEINPWNLWDVQPRRERGWDAAKEPTEKQKTFLAKQGIDTRDLSRGQASQLCGKVIQRFKRKKCTYKQAKTLAKFGCDPDVDFKTAGDIIDRIAKNGWRRPDPEPEPAESGIDVDAIPL